MPDDFGEMLLGENVDLTVADLHPAGLLRQADDGDLAKNNVASVIHASLDKVRACYKRALGNDPTLSGKVVVTFKIRKTGIVASARIASSTLNNLAAENCIVKVIKQLKFPASDTEPIVTYPFLFTSGR